MEAFEQLLQQHQKANTSSGRSILANAIIEHNIFAASKIYNNITFAELAVLLGIPQTEAESLASKLIDEGRMKATIDQVDGVVEFESATESLHVWDDQITQLCGVVNDVLETIVKKHPQYKALVRLLLLLLSPSFMSDFRLARLCRCNRLPFFSFS